MNSGSDLKTSLHGLLQEDDLLENPLGILSIDSPYLYIEDIPNCIPNDNNFLYRSLHINIHSIPDKIDKLKDMLFQFQDIQIEFDFILLCETFLSDNISHLYHIPGYKMVCNNRKKITKGGVAIYIKNHISFKVRDDISMFYEGEFETIFIETTASNHRAVVGEIYRIPNTSEEISVQRYESLLTKLQQIAPTIIIGTDQNFDYLKIESHSKTSDLLNLFLSSHLIPTITKPTRITHTSATLIDNIYVRHDTRTIHSGIIPFNISDHFPVFCFMGKNNKPHKSKSPLTFMHRPIDSDALNRIRSAIHEIDWTYLNNLDVNSAYVDFMERLNSIIYSFAPEKKVVIPAKHVIREAWMSKGLMKSSCTMTKLYKKCVTKPKTDPSYTKFIEYRNHYNTLKRLAKHNYYEQRFDQYKTDIRGTWKLLNSLIGKTKDKSTIQCPFKSLNSNVHISDPTEIATEFGKYFVNVGSQLANSIPSPINDYKYYLDRKKNPNPRSMSLMSTDPNEIFTIIHSFKGKKSTGHDNLSTALLKDISSEISYPVSLLVNQSLAHGIVPDILKIAKVIPIYKCKDRNLYSNYRPISLLPSLSKILEKVMQKRLYNFFESSNLLCKSQYGFRKKTFYGPISFRISYSYR
jgi:hypothetical protein